LDDINKQIDDINNSSSLDTPEAKEVKKIEREITDSELIVSKEIEENIEQFKI
jgi:hypothetical protein